MRAALTLYLGSTALFLVLLAIVVLTQAGLRAVPLLRRRYRRWSWLDRRGTGPSRTSAETPDRRAGLAA